MEVLTATLKEFRVVDYQSLLLLSSAMDAISTNSREMPYTSVEVIQLKLDEIASILSEILANSSYSDVHNLIRRISSISVHLMEVSWPFCKPRGRLIF